MADKNHLATTVFLLCILDDILKIIFWNGTQLSCYFLIKNSNQLIIVEPTQDPLGSRASEIQNRIAFVGAKGAWAKGA